MNYYDAQQQNNGYFNRNNFGLGVNNGGWYNQQQTYAQEPPIIVVPVTGEQAARTYPIEKGRTILLLDFQNHRFWIKSIKPNGLESLCEGYTFIGDAEANAQNQQNQQMQLTEEFQNRFVSREEFELLKKSIDELIK